MLVAGLPAAAQESTMWPVSFRRAPPGHEPEHVRAVSDADRTRSGRWQGRPADHRGLLADGEYDDSEDVAYGTADVALFIGGDYESVVEVIEALP
jgi:hypothetical protein